MRPTTPHMQHPTALTHTRFRLLRFRSPLLTKYLFQQVLRCFTSPRHHPPPINSKGRRPETTRARFPHSDTLGSQLASQLPEAYRRLQRPSSAHRAKASTERPKTPTKNSTKTRTQPTKKKASHAHAKLQKNARVHYTIHNHHTNTTQPTPQQGQPRRQHRHQVPKSPTVCQTPHPQQAETPHKHEAVRSFQKKQPRKTPGPTQTQQRSSLERR